MPKADEPALRRDERAQQLLARQRNTPEAGPVRFGHAAATAARVARLVRRAARRGEVDPEAVTKIVVALAQLKGIGMKVGQILSYIDVALPEELRDALAVLQTHSPPMSFDVVRSIVKEQLPNRADELLAGMDSTPVAAASIGQVHRSRLPDGTAVAVKVQYPGIARTIRTDFSPAALGGAFSSALFPGANVPAAIAEARDRFLEECDYEHEAAAQGRFAAIYADDPVIVVPAVHDSFCTRRVLTTGWLDGQDFERFLATAPTQSTRDAAGTALFDFYVGSLFEHGLYNCDPHPGNYLFLEDGRIGILDYGCTRAFEPEFVGKLARLTRAVHEDRRQSLHDAFLDLGMVRRGQRYDFATARTLVRAFYGPMLHDAVQVVDLGEAVGMREAIRAKMELMRLSLPAEFLFLFRIRFGLMSVLARLGARANWYRLEERWVSQASKGRSSS